MSNKLFYAFIFVGIFVVFASSSVSAVDACTIEPSAADCTAITGGQIVMYLSSSTNAHGELKSSTPHAYGNVLCCNFGSGGTTCTADNEILSLSSATNAHAERPENSNYTEKVCYDSLTNCFAAPGATPGTGEIKVASLSSATNAHIGTSYTTNVICEVNVVIPPNCGNGVINAPEDCDGTNLNGQTCLTQGFTGGTLSCTSGCEFNTAQCTGVPPTCDLTSATWNKALTEEGSQVTLTVTGANCAGAQVSFEVLEDDLVGDDAVSTEPTTVTFSGNTAIGTWTAEFQDDGIGNGDPEYYFIASVVGSSEEIESGTGSGAIRLLTVTENEIGSSCASVSLCDDYSSQTTCNADDCDVSSNSVPSTVDCDEPGVVCRCAWNSAQSECSGAFNTVVSPVCGNGDVETGESCDDGNTANGDGCSATCGLEQAPSCNNNGVINTGEYCDGAALGGETCQSLGFSGGTLACSACGFDISGCTNTGPYCGDDTIDAGEQCDGSEFGPITSCTQFGLQEGTGLSCTSNCEIDTSTPYCTGTAGPCGNNVINPGETCDRNTFAPEVNSCSALDEFIGGDLSCDETCQLDTLECFDAIDPETEGTCLYTADTTDTCDDDGYLTVTWSTQWEGPAGTPEALACAAENNKADTIACPAQIPLPFFDAYNLIIAALIIAGIYVFLNTREKTQ